MHLAGPRADILRARQIGFKILMRAMARLSMNRCQIEDKIYSVRKKAGRNGLSHIVRDEKDLSRFQSRLKELRVGQIAGGIEVDQNNGAVRICASTSTAPDVSQ